MKYYRDCFSIYANTTSVRMTNLVRNDLETDHHITTDIETLFEIWKSR